MEQPGHLGERRHQHVGDVGVDDLPLVEAAGPLVVPVGGVGPHDRDVRVLVEVRVRAGLRVVEEHEDVVGAGGQVAGHEPVEVGGGVLDRRDDAHQRGRGGPGGLHQLRLVSRRTARLILPPGEVSGAGSPSPG